MDLVSWVYGTNIRTKYLGLIKYSYQLTKRLINWLKLDKIELCLYCLQIPYSSLLSTKRLINWILKKIKLCIAYTGNLRKTDITVSYKFHSFLLSTHFRIRSIYNENVTGITLDYSLCRSKAHHMNSISNFLHDWLNFYFLIDTGISLTSLHVSCSVEYRIIVEFIDHRWPRFGTCVLLECFL